MDVGLRTRKKSVNISRNNAGAVIAAGGYGCVFRPPINSTKFKTKLDKQSYITKLMTKREANNEMKSIRKFLPIIKKINGYKSHILLDDIFLAKSHEFGPLADEDKINFNSKCSGPLGESINKYNVNNNISDLSAIYIPDGGITIETALNKSSSYDIGLLTLGIIKVLRNIIVPMNKRGLIHGDLKGSNMLVNENFAADKTIPDIKIIDWGISYVVQPATKPDLFDMSIMYNLPFSCMLLNTNITPTFSILKGEKIAFHELTEMAGKIIKKNIGDYGEGHMGFMKQVFSKISPKFPSNKSLNDYMKQYIATILEKYLIINRGILITTISIDVDKYFHEVYRHNCDIWGVMSSYVGIEFTSSKMSDIIINLLYKYLYSSKYAAVKIPLAELEKDLLKIVRKSGVKGSMKPHKLSKRKRHPNMHLYRTFKKYI